jgi:hypothetical protein
LCDKPAPPPPRAVEKMLTDLANYQPQQFLSPAEMLELEAAFEGEHDVYIRLCSTPFTLVSTADVSLSHHGHGHHGQAVNRPMSTSSTAATHFACICLCDRSLSNWIGADAYQPLGAAVVVAAATATTSMTPPAPMWRHSLMHRPTRARLSLCAPQLCRRRRRLCTPHTRHSPQQASCRQRTQTGTGHKPKAQVSPRPSRWKRICVRPFLALARTGVRERFVLP